MGTELVTHIRKPKVAKNKLSKTEHYILHNEDIDEFYTFMSTETKIEEVIEDFFQKYNLDLDSNYTLYKAIGSVEAESRPVLSFRYDKE